MLKEVLDDLQKIKDKIDKDCAQIIKLTEELRELNRKCKAVLNNMEE